jgi:hypothetical protein
MKFGNDSMRPCLFINRISGLFLVAVTVTACGGGASHPVCKDEASTNTYVQKFTTDLMAAAQAGKIDAAALQSFQGDMTKAMSEAAEKKDWAAVCTVLDDARKKGGF